MALSRLYPLDMNLTFEDRLYSLGETIRVLVELAPRRDVVVREARVDLVCEEDFVMSYTVMSPDRPSVTSQARAPGEVYISPPMVPQRVKKVEKEAYVHSAVQFLGDATLQQGSPTQYDIDLFINTQSPPRVSVARIEWRLEGFVDVVMARDVRARYAIRVELG